MEVAATVDVTFDSAENQGGRVRRPAEGTFTLKPRAAATLALAALVVASEEKEKRSRWGQNVQFEKKTPP